MNGRDKRRVLGMMNARLPEARLGRVPDPRAGFARGRSVRAILSVIAAAMAAGCRSLVQAEDFTDEMASEARPVLGIRGRMPDTTMRDLLTRLAIDPLRRALHRLVRYAHRRKALTAGSARGRSPLAGSDEAPFGMLSMDGKSTAITAWDDELAQRQVHGGSASGGACGVVRTITSVLATSRARPCLDVSPIPAANNPGSARGQGPLAGRTATTSGHSTRCWRPTNTSTSSGWSPTTPAAARRPTPTPPDSGTSITSSLPCEGAPPPRAPRLDDKQPTLAREAERLLAHRPVEQADASTEERTGRGIEHRYVFVTSEMAGFHDWSHLRTVLRVRREIRSDDGELRSGEDRYALSSLAVDRLRPAQWLHLTRIRWSVENEGHHTLDTAFAEDDRPWIEADPPGEREGAEPPRWGGTVAVMVLRRLVYTLLALYRSTTQRSEKRRRMPWATLMRWIYNAFIAARPEDAARLRRRRCPATDG